MDEVTKNAPLDIAKAMRAAELKNRTLKTYVKKFYERPADDKDICGHINSELAQVPDGKVRVVKQFATINDKHALVIFEEWSIPEEVDV